MGLFALPPPNLDLWIEFTISARAYSQLCMLCLAGLNRLFYKTGAKSFLVSPMRQWIQCLFYRVHADARLNEGKGFDAVDAYVFVGMVLVLAH